MLMWNHLGEILMAAAGMQSIPASTCGFPNIGPNTGGPLDPAQPTEVWRTLISS